MGDTMSDRRAFWVVIVFGAVLGVLLVELYVQSGL